MARQARHDADYFPFIVKEGKTLFILESKYGLQGIGFFTNLMRFLTRQPDHHVCVQEESDRIYFFAQLHCPEDIGMDMLNLMVKTGKIDAQLWTEKRVIVSNDLLDSLQDAYKNRKNKIITLEEIRQSYHNNPISYPDNTAHAALNPEIEGRNPQRKGKDRIGKERKEDISMSETEKTVSDGNGKYPSCPQTEIINLYHKTLPELPRVKHWPENLQVILRTRWKEDPVRQNLDWWEQYFRYVQESDFLMGRTKEAFVADLEWLVRPKNFTKIANGRYHGRGGLSAKPQPGISAWLEERNHATPG